MSFEKPLLTVGIPTYNGAKYLSQAIESVLGQFPEVPAGAVELIVSDNLSSDETLSIANGYAERSHGCVTVFANERNVGFDANVDLVVRRARGDFVWLLSDDDFLLEGALAEVLEVVLQHPELALVFANYDNGIPLGLGEDAYCANGDLFFRKSRFKSGFVSSCIVKKGVWLELEMSRQVGTAWIHMDYALRALAPLSGRPSYILCRDLVKQDGEPRWGGGGRFIDTGLSFVGLMKDIEGMGYARETRKLGEMVIKSGYLRLIPIAVSNGLRVDLPLLRKFASSYRSYLSFWCVDLPLLLVPRSCYSGAIRAYRALKRCRAL